jgi:enolase
MEVVATDMVALKGDTMAEIVKTIGREILDSRGHSTMAADVRLADGSMGRAAATCKGARE